MKTRSSTRKLRSPIVNSKASSGETKATETALAKQVGGDHYKNQGIQPVEYIHANSLNFFEGNAIKYITRHRTKGGRADLEKAIHYLELIIELEYGTKTE